MRAFFFVIAALVFPTAVFATAPPIAGGSFPDAYFERLDSHPQAFTYKRALYDVAARATVARVLGLSSNLAILSEQSQFSNKMQGLLGLNAAPTPLGFSPEFVSGTRNIPVIMTYFPETAKVPYPVAQLQQELFDGPWKTGTMSAYYSEVSGGALTVKGTVRNWTKLKQSSVYYVGKDYLDKNGKLTPCYGLCNQSKVADYVLDALQASKDVDWGQYDNDGPDGIPNSGDDDGFVDFVALVQPNSGSECQDNPGSIWSHRSSITSWGRKEFTTTTPRKGGGFIAIDDYVVMPALACDRQTMIQIGVFAHEFGHAFGLPDLYDTDPSDGRTAGLGHWCLMAAGSWGADGKSAETPTHMSPWAKAYLGWIAVKEIDHDNAKLNLTSIEDSRIAYRINISSKLYYILNATRRTGFNRNIPAEGLQIWRVNETAVKAGLPSNRVNAVNSNRGVALVEADGLERMMSDNFRGDSGDIFPGSVAKISFDATGKPASDGRISICNIARVADGISAAVFVTRNSCSGMPPLPAVAVAAAADAVDPAQIVLVASSSPNVSVAEASAAALGTTVQVSGTLINSGTNLFDRKTRRIVLVDKNGEEIEVTPQMALERPLDAAGTSEPATLSSVLNKEVTINATVGRALRDQARPALNATSIQVK